MYFVQVIKQIKPFEQKVVSVANERGNIELSLKATSFKTQDEELILLSVQDVRNEVNEKTIQTTVRGLNVIREQGNGLIGFVESYRKLTRLPNPDKKIFKADELVNRIKVLYSSLENSEHVKLAVFVNPPEIELFADENLVTQVLLNLLKNALEAIGQQPDGNIQLMVGMGANNRPEILVKDNGPGISGEIAAQIFIPFFTTSEKGSGIGLSVSRQIMRLHNGSLTMRSVPAKETVFRLGF